MIRDDTQSLMRQAAGGDASALSQLLEESRGRLRRMVEMRLDARLHRRVDASDILQETLIEAARRFDDYLERKPAPFHVWLRMIAGDKLKQAWRRHVGVKQRAVDREIPLDANGIPDATSQSISMWLSRRQASPSAVAMEAESHEHMLAALDGLDPHDRDVLVLRHFEQLSNVEAAHVLGIDPSAASNRYVRALKRLRERAMIGASPSRMVN